MLPLSVPYVCPSVPPSIRPSVHTSHFRVRAITPKPYGIYSWNFTGAYITIRRCVMNKEDNSCIYLRSRSETYVLLFRRRRCPCRRRRRRKLFGVKAFFSETIRARAMKLGSCIHLEELRSTLCSILRLDLLFTVHWLCNFFLSFGI